MANKFSHSAFVFGASLARVAFLVGLLWTVSDALDGPAVAEDELPVLSAIFVIGLVDVLKKKIDIESTI